MNSTQIRFLSALKFAGEDTLPNTFIEKADDFFNLSGTKFVVLGPYEDGVGGYEVQKMQQLSSKIAKIFMYIKALDSLYALVIKRKRAQLEHVIVPAYVFTLFLIKVISRWWLGPITTLSYSAEALDCKEYDDSVPISLDIVTKMSWQQVVKSEITINYGQVNTTAVYLGHSKLDQYQDSCFEVKFTLDHLEVTRQKKTG